MSLTSHTIIEKQPSESLNCSMDFANYVSGSSITISSPSVTASPAGLTLGSPSVDGQTVEFTVSGGTDGQNYRIQCTITTSDSETLVGDGILKVRGI